MRIYFIVLAFVLTVLTGCASSPPMMRSDVTVFHEWPQQLQDKSFSFKHSPGVTQSLEKKSYEHLVIDQLTRYGFSYKEGNAALLVEFEPQISEREITVREVIDPFFTGNYMYGGFASPFWGPYYPSFWGVGWRTPVERSYTTVIYTRTLRLSITTAAGKRLFEARAISEGTSRDMTAIMPGLVESVFEGFPGESGKLRTVKVPLLRPTTTSK